MKPCIGVVVVAYRSEKTIDACIGSILKQEEVSRVVVVDNSPVDTLKYRLDADDRLHYLHRPDNPGFARACNIGAAMLCGHTHVAFVNPDVVLQRPLAELAEVEQNQPFAVVSGGLASRVTEAFSNARCAATLRREMMKAVIGSHSYILRDLPPGISLPVGQLDGALLVLAADTFSRLGGFDERFELYYEDVDLCRAATEFGGSALVTRLFGLHIGGVSSAQVGAHAYSASRVSRIRFFRKWSRRRWPTTLTLGLIASVELAARTLGRTSEGWENRIAGYRVQLQELRRPDSIACLPHPKAGNGA